MGGARLRKVDQAAHVGRRVVREMGDELREARLRAGLSQQDVARALGSSQTRVSLVELGQFEAVPLVLLATHAAVVGLRLHARMYPAGPAIRDQAQLALLERFRKRLSPEWRVRLEVPIPLPGDQRAWDMLLTSSEVSIGVEAFSRIRDVQAQLRAVQLKRTESGATRLVLLAAATQGNRRALTEAGPLIRSEFRIGTRSALAALGEGRDPGGDALVWL